MSRAPTPPLPGPHPSALFFDGIDDHVTMGTASEFGLNAFTVETWFRRDGPECSDRAARVA